MPTVVMASSLIHVQVWYADIEFQIGLVITIKQLDPQMSETTIRQWLHCNNNFIQ